MERNRTLARWEASKLPLTPSPLLHALREDLHEPRAVSLAEVARWAWLPAYTLGGALAAVLVAIRLGLEPSTLPAGRLTSPSLAAVVASSAAVAAPVAPSSP